MVSILLLNLGQYFKARFGQDFNFRFSRDADVWLRFEGYLTGEGCTEKCSLITSDENQNNIPYLSDDVIKPVTSLMSLLSGAVSYHMPSLKK